MECARKEDHKGDNHQASHENTISGMPKEKHKNH